LDRKSHPLALLTALALEGGCGSQGGIESQVIGLALRRARLDVAAALAVRMGARTATRAFAVEFVERGI
jgi:hypothetical protein